MPESAACRSARNWSGAARRGSMVATRSRRARRAVGKIRAWHPDIDAGPRAPRPRRVTTVTSPTEAACYPGAVAQRGEGRRGQEAGMADDAVRIAQLEAEVRRLRGEREADRSEIDFLH